MKIIFNDDYPAGIGTAGIETDVILMHARLVNGQVIDASKLTTFYIDAQGLKHAVKRDDYQEVECAFDDELVQEENDVWRKRNTSDEVADLQNQYEAELLVVSNTRESLYKEQVDRLRNEAASIRRVDGDEEKAEEYEAQADAAYLKIREENPWPENPASTSESETSSS